MPTSKAMHRRPSNVRLLVVRVAVLVILGAAVLATFAIRPSNTTIATFRPGPVASAAPSVRPIPPQSSPSAAPTVSPKPTDSPTKPAVTTNVETAGNTAPAKSVGQNMKILFDGRNERSVPRTEGNRPLGEYRYGAVIVVVGRVTGEDPYGTGHSTWLKTSNGTYVWDNGDIVPADAVMAAQQAKPAAPAAPKPQSACVRPSGARITSGYGWRTNDDGSREFHKGIDFGGSFGSAILAAREGTVINAELTNNGFGAWVRIRHADGKVSVYGHINSWLVHVGQHVDAGQQIATVGQRGQADGPHLHFGVDSTGNYNWVDPGAWLAACGVNV